MVQKMDFLHIFICLEEVFLFVFCLWGKALGFQATPLPAWLSGVALGVATPIVDT